MTQTAAKKIPDGMHTVTAHLICAEALKAIEFYRQAFGAEQLFLLQDDGGKVMNACLQIGDSRIMLIDEFPDWDVLGPKARNGAGVHLHLYVEDSDAAFDRAVKAGATPVTPLADMFWGDRYGQVEDPFGHRWSVATHLRDVTPEQMKQAMKDAPQCN